MVDFPSGWVSSSFRGWTDTSWLKKPLITCWLCSVAQGLQVHILLSGKTSPSKSWGQRSELPLGKVKSLLHSSSKTWITYACPSCTQKSFEKIVYQLILPLLIHLLIYLMLYLLYAKLNPFPQRAESCKEDKHVNNCCKRNTRVLELYKDWAT